MFIFPKTSKPDMQPIQLPIQQVPGVILPGVERPERGAVLSFPSSSYVKNRWVSLSFPHSTGVYNEKFTFLRKNVHVECQQNPTSDSVVACNICNKNVPPSRSIPGSTYFFCARSTATPRSVGTQLMGSKSRKSTRIFISVHRANRFRAQITELCVRLEVLRVLNIKIAVPWDVIQFSLTDRYQLFRETYYFQERNPPVIYGWDGRNTAIYLRIRSSSPKTDSRLNRK